MKTWCVSIYSAGDGRLQSHYGWARFRGFFIRCQSRRLDRQARRFGIQLRRRFLLAWCDGSVARYIAFDSAGKMYVAVLLDEAGLPAIPLA